MFELHVLERDHPGIRATEEDDLAASRAALDRMGKPAYLAGMFSLEVLRWLEPREWEIKVGGWFYIIKFKEANDAIMFKLTWL
jgi:hypothetical protein